MLRIPLIAALLILPLAGCGKRQTANGNEVPKDNFARIEENDPLMAAAIAKARATVDTFIIALRSPKKGRSAFAVKIAFADGKNIEHMWLTPVLFAGKRFHG